MVAGLTALYRLTSWVSSAWITDYSSDISQTVHLTIQHVVTLIFTAEFHTLIKFLKDFVAPLGHTGRSCLVGRP